MNNRLSRNVGGNLKKRGWNVALAESCTGGLLGNLITDIPGSSDYFVGGIIAYSNRIKIGVLNVPAEVVEREGAVSEETALFMVRGVREIFGSETALSVTGIAGPSGGTPQKPVGLVYTAALVPGREEVEKHNFSGGRNEIKKKAAEAALTMLRRLL